MAGLFAGQPTDNLGGRWTEKVERKAADRMTKEEKRLWVREGVTTDGAMGKMRSDWVIVASIRRAPGGDWEEGDESEVLASIREAVASGDRVVIGCWAEWLANQASELVATAVGINDRVRAAISEAKLAAAKGGVDRTEVH